LHNRPVARSAPRNQGLEIGPDVAPVLRPEEAARLHEVLDLDRLRCAVCGAWIERVPNAATSVSVSLDGHRAAIEFAHAGCSASRADLAALVVAAEAQPLGINYVQALHPDAGAVLLWERKLDLRVHGLARKEECVYLDPDWWDGFHTALADEPVRLLVGWLLVRDGEDLVLRRGDLSVERFHGAVDSAPPGWLESLLQSGFCLLIVGAGMGLRSPEAAAIQRAIRERRALMGLAEFDVPPAGG
jgi:hypothetical protein